MKKQILSALVLACAAAGAFAATAAPAAAPAASKTLTPQQQKMSDCAKSNKGKKGDDYKSSMKSCLSNKPGAMPAAATATAAPAAATASAAAPTQQQKMAGCAQQNKGKKGDDYKNGVKACMAA